MAKVSLRAYNREIETMIDRGQLDEAIAHCRHILKTYPKHLETYRLLGKAYLEYKRHGEAADIFSRILVSVPDDFVAQVGMSIIRDEENRLDDAIWHMERAFETQPSNPAIQAELQRLYARRDGVRPPRIRMTRGALAHMYVQGELYPQAISEIKSVLKDDPARADMQALLARASYKSGLRNEAADVASALLRRYPYSLDANRVLVEILGSDHPESAQLYRQRVFELDPYAAHVSGNVFTSGEVSDAAVNVERLDWNGQPVSMQPDWGEARAIGGDAQAPEEQEPSWLNPPTEEAPHTEASQATPAPIFDPLTREPAPDRPEDDIPDFMRAAGWGRATGAFDESQSTLADESAEAAAPIEQGDLPDWVRAMKPAEAETPAPSAEEELPDWIANIGAGALASQAGEQPDWMEQLESPSEPAASAPGELAGGPEQTASSLEPAASEEPGGELDWLKDLGDAGAPAPPGESGGLEWLQELGDTEPTAAVSRTEDLDWLKNLGETEPVVPAEGQGDLGWMKDLESPGTTMTGDEEAQPDWLKAAGEVDAPPAGMAEEQPEWLTSPGDETGAGRAAEADFLDQLSEEPILQTPAEPAAPPADLDRLGVSEQERDDSFAWLESLAAKQGATEGLLTDPEDRLEEEPEWVRQAKSLGTGQPAAAVPEEPASAGREDLGKSEQEQDDSFAWLESLAAKQGATEGLLTQPEDRLDEEPEWVKRARELDAPEPPGMVMPEPELEHMASTAEPEPEPEAPAGQDDAAAWPASLEEQGPPAGEALASVEEPAAPTGQGSSAEDEIETWLKDLEGEAAPSGPLAETDETAMWLKGLEEKEPVPTQPVEAAGSALPDWLEEIGEEQIPAGPAAPESEGELEETWMPPAEETPPTPAAEPAAEESLPAWLSELDKEEQEQVAAPAGEDDLPAWLRGEETAPEASEPMRPSDWRRSEEARREPAYEQPAPAEEPARMDVSEVEDIVEEIEQIAVEEPGPSPEMEAPALVPEPAPEPEPVRDSGLSIPAVDPVLGQARSELSGNNLGGALASYDRLIKKARYLDEVIYDLREATYLYPVDVSLWQSLGDAYMRANRLQDALDAYTKAEELLR